MICGVYQIRNVLDGELYVGSAVETDRRWDFHLYQLRKGIHTSQRLQEAWNRDGEESFIFEILLPCAPEELAQEEERIQAELCPTYNERLRGYTLSEETRQKISAAALEVASRPGDRERRSERAKQQPRSDDHERLSFEYTPEVRENMRAAALKRFERLHANQTEEERIARSEEMSRRSYQRRIFTEDK